MRRKDELVLDLAVRCLVVFPTIVEMQEGSSTTAARNGGNVQTHVRIHSAIYSGACERCGELAANRPVTWLLATKEYVTSCRHYWDQPTLPCSAGGQLGSRVARWADSA